jgi:LPXTG-motif cell wall-anchored protein
MKKALALLVAALSVLTINLGVLAAETDTGVTGGTLWAADNTAATPRISLTKNQLVLGFESEGVPIVVLPGTFLLPGKQYTYKLYRVDQDYTSVEPNKVAMTALTDTNLNGGAMKIRSVKGSANVISAQIEKSGDNYNFVIETKKTYGAKISELEYTIVVTGQGAAIERVLDATLTFETGYRAMADEDIADYVEGDVVVIDPDAPVITKEQFATLAENYDYEAVSFTGDNYDWQYTGRVSGMTDANCTTPYEVIEEIIEAYPDYDYRFITFNAGITFPTNGELRLDVADLMAETSALKLYAYLYRNGTLTPISATYDSTADQLVFRTNYLGAFVISSEQIVDFNYDPGPDLIPIERDPDETQNNPPTGAATMGAVIALGLLSLAGAGAVARKRTRR